MRKFWRKAGPSSSGHGSGKVSHSELKVGEPGLNGGHSKKISSSIRILSAVEQGDQFRRCHSCLHISWKALKSATDRICRCENCGQTFHPFYFADPKPVTVSQLRQIKEARPEDGRYAAVLGLVTDW